MNEQRVRDLAKSYGFTEFVERWESRFMLSGVGDIWLDNWYIGYSFAKTRIFVSVKRHKFREADCRKLEDELLRALILSAF